MELNTNELQFNNSHPKPKSFLGRFFAVLLFLVLIAAAAFTYFYSKIYFNLNSQLYSITHAQQITPTPTPPSSS